MDGGEIRPSQSAELAYDPDQKPEEKRKVRAQYRQLLGEQNGGFERVSRVLSCLVSESLTFTNRAPNGFEQPNCRPTLTDPTAG